jgi:membrane protein YdbS with pleckstrin-like domain
MHYDARPAWRYQWSAAASVALMLAALMLAAVYGPAHAGERVTHVLVAVAGALATYFVLLMLYRRLSWRYLIDEHSIDSYHGVLARRVHSIRIEDVRDVAVNQSPVQRALNVGDVEFTGADANAVVVFFGVTDPLELLRLAQQLRSRVARVEN